MSNIKNDFFKFLEAEDYSKRYIQNLTYGLNIVVKEVPFNKIISKISNARYPKQISERLKPKYGYDIAKLALSVLNRLRDFLINADMIEADVAYRTSGFFQEVEKELIKYAEEEKEYSKPHKLRLIKEFYEFTNLLKSLGKDDFTNVSQEDVFHFFRLRKPTLSSAVAIRILLKFLKREKYLSKDFRGIILCARQKDNEVRKFLSPADVKRLLAANNRGTIIGKRNYLVFLLMAELGLRCIEVLRLTLDDIKWKKSRIFIHGKHDRLTELPFAQEIGDAIIDYLEHAKRLTSDNLILSTKPPYNGMSDVDQFAIALRKLYHLSGVKCPTQNYRLNVYRHSLATERLNAGVPMITVQKLLRHDNVDTTMVYAKYNLSSLSNLAVKWPGARA